MTATEAAVRIERLFAEVRTEGFSISGAWPERMAASGG